MNPVRRELIQSMRSNSCTRDGHAPQRPSPQTPDCERMNTIRAPTCLGRSPTFHGALWFGHSGRNSWTVWRRPWPLPYNGHGNSLRMLLHPARQDENPCRPPTNFTTLPSICATRATSQARSPSSRKRSIWTPALPLVMACWPSFTPTWPKAIRPSCTPRKSSSSSRTTPSATPPSRWSTSRATASPKPSTPRPWPIRSRWASSEPEPRDVQKTRKSVAISTDQCSEQEFMSGGFAAVLLLLACQQGAPGAQPEPTVAPASAADPWYASHRDEFLGLYTHLHTHPELSYQEVETAARVSAELKRAGAKVTTGVGKLGVVGVIENGPGPVVLVRTDMDALPVVEQTGLPYASK